MKKLNFITTILFSSLVYAGECDTWSYRNNVNGSRTPYESGKYVAISKEKTYSDGTPLKIGNFFHYTNWENDSWYKSNWISCSITDIELKFGYAYGDKYDSCYLISLDCSVVGRTQFFKTDVKYTDLKGFRRNGTLKWTRDKVGSTDIYCYDKSGLTIVKHVNDPYYCK